MEYKVVPFTGQSRGNVSAADIAKQLEIIINQHVAMGWEFWQLADVNIEVQPGCLAGLLGAKAQYVRLDQVIFRNSSKVTIGALPAPPQTPPEPKGSSPIVEQAKEGAPVASSDGRSARDRNGVQRCPHCGQSEGSHDVLCIESMRM
jgi:hypothetical protein